MDKIGNYIRRLRNEKGLTQEQLGEMVGVQKAAVQKWENGSVQNLKRATIKKLAEIFDVSPASFVKDDDAPEPSNIRAVITDGIYNVPVFGSVSAGFGAYASDCVLDYIPVIIKNPSDVDNTIAIKVDGDSMSPKIENGDIIVVRRQTSVDSGDIGVVLLDGDEGLVKRIVYGPTWIELQSINEKYSVQRFDGAEVQRLRVVGKVVGSYKTF
ncbi:MAG: helix-turn-helix domain-containing protein [Oscillospiraceae bacterium]|nr:helix-turn-helix domain-containing protein [Oscillospiraceae bacterium]